MTKISYELKENTVCVSLEGRGDELLKGVSRLAADLKRKLDLKEGEFEKILLQGIKVAEMENKLNENFKGDELERLDELIGMLKDLLND